MTGLYTRFMSIERYYVEYAIKLRNRPRAIYIITTYILINECQQQVTDETNY